MQDKIKKVLVTGAAGFIGSHLVDTLLDQGFYVTAVDDFSRGSRENLPNNIKLKIIEADLRLDVNLDEIFKDQDVVFNLAALNTGVDYDLGRTEVMFEDNMLLQMIPLKVAGRVGVKTFVQISSASVYSRYAMENIIPTPETADTTDPEPSKLGYALAKKMGEHLAVWYSENTKMQTRIVRFINVYGERDNYDEKGHFIPVMIRKFLMAKDEVLVFGSGKQKRSFIYVHDAVSALLAILYKGENGEAYNVDSSNEFSVEEVVNKIARFVKKDLKIVFDTTKPEGSLRRILDATKLETLGWQANHSFDYGLKQTFLDIRKRLNHGEN